MLLPIPKSKIGYVISEEFACLQKREKVLLFDRGVKDETQNVYFIGKTTGLHDLELHRN